MAGHKRARAWLLLAVTIALHVAIARSGSARDVSQRAAGLVKRSSEDTPHQTLLAIPYAEWYERVPTSLRPLYMAFLVLVLTFLFTSIGITASDFFCPNLSTVATQLGLSESTAGVTFLAFGNGSPDVFSTFSAVREGTFGLAVGELIGAASFITSIVVGSIAMVRPFHVPRHAFLRDIVFFTLAVLVLVAVLADGQLSLAESGGMIGLYVAYVAFVVAGNWWASRRRKQREHRDLGWKVGGEEAVDEEERSGRVDVQDEEPSLPPRRVPSPASLEPPSPSPRSRTGSASSLTLPRIGRPRASTTSSPHAHFSPLVDHHSHHHHFHPHNSHLYEDDLMSDTPRAGFSLLGAVEFRDVVNSLRKESHSPSRTANASPLRTPHRDIREGRDEPSDYFSPLHAFQHRRTSAQVLSAIEPVMSRQASIKGHRRSVSVRTGPLGVGSRAERHQDTSRVVSDSATVGLVASEPNPWEDQLGKPPSTASSSPPLAAGKPDRLRLLIPGTEASTSAPPASYEVPSIAVVDPSGALASPVATPGPIELSESRFAIRRNFRRVLHCLFPSFISFRHKSVLGMVLAIISMPAILVLTITLPVVDDGQASNEGGVALPVGDDEPLDEEVTSESDSHDGNGLLRPGLGDELHHLVETGFSPLHSPLGRIYHSRRASQNFDFATIDNTAPDATDAYNDSCSDSSCDSEMDTCDVLQFSRPLTAVQCVLGPLFCTLVAFQGQSYLPWVLMGTGLCGLGLATIVIMYATDGTRQPWRLVRCFCGFVCSMMWIGAIADEVVSVLQTMGEVFGLSDAIVGLTIFAVGNSLADLVANVTVAQFAPAMAYAACFGGPMLNLLLGIGGSGTYSILSKPSRPHVAIDFSPTLWVSAIGLVLILVATAIFVPLNGYLIDRRWAACLLVAYASLMTANVVVEIKTGRA